MNMKPLATAALFGLTAACATVPPSGAYPQALLGKEWMVEEIAGRQVIPDARPTLLFSPDGRLSGSTSCNRLIATYSARGTKLAITPAGTTMMACPPAVMEQERRLLDVLKGVTSYRAEASGQLVLVSRSGATLKAR